MTDDTAHPPLDEWLLAGALLNVDIETDERAVLPSTQAYTDKARRIAAEYARLQAGSPAQELTTLARAFDEANAMREPATATGTERLRCPFCGHAASSHNGDGCHCGCIG